MAAARGNSQRYHRKHPQGCRAVHHERIKLSEWPAIKPQEVNRTDADKDVQPHRKQASAERSQTCGMFRCRNFVVSTGFSW
jgi:hypothetical protein